MLVTFPVLLIVLGMLLMWLRTVAWAAFAAAVARVVAVPGAETQGPTVLSALRCVARGRSDAVGVAGVLMMLFMAPWIAMGIVIIYRWVEIAPVSMWIALTIALLSQPGGYVAAHVLSWLVFLCCKQEQPRQLRTAEP